MSQVTIYLDPETEAKLQAAVDASGLSKSKWIAELIRSHVAQEWPATIRLLAGSWQDFPDLDDLRGNEGQDCDREHF